MKGGQISSVTFEGTPNAEDFLHVLFGEFPYRKTPFGPAGSLVPSSSRPDWPWREASRPRAAASPCPGQANGSDGACSRGTEHSRCSAATSSLIPGYSRNWTRSSRKRRQRVVAPISVPRGSGSRGAGPQAAGPCPSCVDVALSGYEVYGGERTASCLFCLRVDSSFQGILRV